jgi:hypothetical protein
VIRAYFDTATFAAGFAAAIVGATTRSPGWTLMSFMVGLVAGILIGRWSRART